MKIFILIIFIFSIQNSFAQGDSIANDNKNSLTVVQNSIKHEKIKNLAKTRFGLKASYFNQIGESYFKLAGFDAGFTLPIFLGNPVTGKGLVIHPDVLFRMTKFNMYYGDRDGMRSSTGKDVGDYYNVTLYNISIPLNFEYRFLSNVGFIIGPNIDIALGASSLNRVTKKYPYSNSNFYFGNSSTDDFNRRINLSLSVGIIGYASKSTSQQLTYQIGFIDHSPEDVKKAITNAVSLSMGFHFSKRSK